MKKLLSTLLAILLIISAIPLGVFTFTVSAAKSGYYSYSVSNGAATITDCDNSISGSVTIPSTLGGYPVTRIGDSAFYDCYRLTSITIPDSVTSIGDYAFYWCTSLTSITIPDSVTSIGDSAFYDCDSLTSITIPDSVTSIGYCAFYWCTSLTAINVDENNGSYCSVDGVLFNKDKTILVQYPAGKTDATYIIPDSVTSIGGYAFYWCTSLTSVTIPDSVKSIGEGAFSYCKRLTAINVDENNGSYCSVDGVLFNKDKTTLVQYPAGKTGATYIIPDSVTSIGYGAFENCTSLTSITIPDSVTSIGSDAFCNCTRLTSITIPDGVTSIGSGAFWNCTSLTSITIPDSVTSIGARTFCWCESLTSITIPDSVTSIGEDAFHGCTSLESITIPDSVTSIGIRTFYGCTSLTDVWYTGSETDKQNITNGSYNTYLTLATWHYNTCNPSEHTYANNSDTTCENCEWVRELYKPGDTNDDGKINNRDYALLMQFINKWDVTIIEDAADVNADGKINNRDYALLMQFINKWDVELHTRGA